MIRRIKPCVYVCDDTDCYDLSSNRKWIKRIENIYLYDGNEIVHCCELAGSHWCEHIYTAIDFADGTPEEVQEELRDYYCGTVLDGQYVHAACMKPARVLDFEDYELSEDFTEDDAWADCVDYYRCNVPY